MQSAAPVVSSIRPLRVVVAGSSVAYFLRPPRVSSGEGCYGQELVPRLGEAGIPARVDVEARWMDEVHVAFHHVEGRVFAKSPDVVVLDFGWVECQPNLFPTLLYKYLATFRPRLNPRTRQWRIRFGRPVYRAYTRWTPVLDARWPLPSRMPIERFEEELRRFVDTLRREMGSLVLLMNVNPTTDRVIDHFPTIQERAERYSAVVDAVAGQDDPFVRLVDTRSLVLEHGCEAILPDGIHYNARGHGLVADLLAEEIRRWVGATTA